MTDNQLNIAAVFNRSTLAELDLGKSYYSAMHRHMTRVADNLHLQPAVFMGVFCALSPQLDEDQNWRAAIRLCQHWRLSTEYANWSLPDKVEGVNGYPANRRKAWDILCSPPASVYPGERVADKFFPWATSPKTRSFFLNLWWPMDLCHRLTPKPVGRLSAEAWDAVTIDGHAYNIWRYGVRQPAGFRPPSLQRIDARISGRVYEQVANDYRLVADGLRLRPHQLQAVTWHTWKRLHYIRHNPQLRFDFAAPYFAGSTL